MEKVREEYKASTLKSAQCFLNEHVFATNGQSRKNDARPMFMVHPNNHRGLALLARNWAKAVHE